VYQIESSELIQASMTGACWVIYVYRASACRDGDWCWRAGVP